MSTALYFMSRLISTHALTWSATGDEFVVSNFKNISTHALTWSATITSKNKLEIEQSNFNSRAHVERDMDDVATFVGDIISTHALTWSATRCITAVATSLPFQLTRSRGARPQRAAVVYLTQSQFQLTRSRGARRSLPFLDTIGTAFQLTRSRGARRAV